VRRYAFLVHNAAQRYGNSPEPVEELTQAGYIGLLNAINRFDATRGAPATFISVDVCEIVEHGGVPGAV
jgi:DNA-directed RNA polymerase specialized sigma subunit